MWGFNKQLPEISKQLVRMKFVTAFKYPTVTHRQGGHLDQVFVRNLQLKSAVISEGYYDQISDHKCLKATVKLKEKAPPIQIKNHSISA